MNTQILNRLSLLSQALSKPLSTQLLSIMERQIAKSRMNGIPSFVNIYASFIFSQGKQNFSAIDILNDEDKFKAHLEQLVGFVYCETNVNNKTKYENARVICRALLELAENNNIHIAPQAFSSVKVNDYTQSCIEYYQSLERNEDKLAYLNGWSVMSQERKELPIDLDFLYVKYGQTFTNKIHAALKQYGLTQKHNTLDTKIFSILALLKTTVTLDAKASVESLELLLSAQCVQSTFYKVYQLQLAECLAKGNDLVSFNKTFKASLDAYTSAFINTKLYPAPLKDFIAPTILKVKNPPSFSSGGKPSDVEQMRWFGGIPLHIKDDQAVEIVNDRINRDMNFLKAVLNAYFNELKQRQARNESFIETGIIKPLEGNKGSRKGQQGGSVAYEIGENHLENTIATFYHYGINGYKSLNSYSEFLRFRGKNRELLTELNLPTNATLFALTALLVMEHPKITPSWLQKLQLFNENGKLRGYIQAGEQHILTSDKDRRGRNLAQQDVVLNAYSKSIVDFIVQHTDIARQHLKSIGNPDWKFLLLTCSLNKAVKPNSKTQLYMPFPVVKPLLSNKALMPLECDLSQQDIDTIASITTHRSIRRHRGLQIYLETRSQSAVADALGHKEVNQELMDAYLPKPLMDFFTERVVRQFQKAIILEAMKDSPYLLDAVNMTYEQIEEFLANHGLNDIPDFKETSSFDKAASQDEQSVFNKVVFTITLPLLQLLMSIKTIIDNDNDKSDFNELVQHWYQCATYLFRCIEMPDFDYADIRDMYQEAKATPFDHSIIKEAISC